MDFEDLLDCGKLVAMMLFLAALLLNCGGVETVYVDSGTTSGGGSTSSGSSTSSTSSTGTSGGSTGGASTSGGSSTGVACTPDYEPAPVSDDAIRCDWCCAAPHNPGPGAGCESDKRTCGTCVPQGGEIKVRQLPEPDGTSFTYDAQGTCCWDLAAAFLEPTNANLPDDAGYRTWLCEPFCQVGTEGACDGNATSCADTCVNTYATTSALVGDTVPCCNP